MSEPEPITGEELAEILRDADLAGNWDIPRLIAEIKRQRAEIERLKVAHQATLDEFRDRMQIGLKFAGNP